MPFMRPRLGCLGFLAFALGLATAVYGVIAPWSFHIGGRWTPVTWWGVGRLRDSNGAQYGIYLYFYPDFRGASRLGGLGMRCGLRGKATVCTAAGAKYQFNLSGQIYGAWLDTDGKEISFNLSEPRGPKLRRAFDLYGAWQGSELPLDDHKSMIMHFLPDGRLTPAGSYTSPLPEKHAKVTLRWGSESDFDSLCNGLSH
jgi:hypothetical protein